jgi:long-chain acyl-CoA synthetase
MVCAFINIDLQAVGNWAEKRNMPYAGYLDLTSRPEVYDLMLKCIEQVNADLASEPQLASSQVRRFLILHKELDADDDELTRTRKVRRGFVAQKYAALIEALYSGQDHCRIATEVKFEDGRRGTIEADIRIRDTNTGIHPAKAA